MKALILLVLKVGRNFTKEKNFASHVKKYYGCLTLPAVPLSEVSVTHGQPQYKNIK